MASFKELCELNKAGSLNDSGFIKEYDVGSIFDHLSSEISKTNNDFVLSHQNVPGVIDYDSYGFTEPEQERDCYFNNLALFNLNYVMPYLERMNTHLSDDEIASQGYSKKTLHLACECYAAFRKGVSEDKINYMIDSGFPLDKNKFGAKCHEYEMHQLRRYFEQGLTIENAQIMADVNEEARGAIDDYISIHGFDENIISTIGKAGDMGTAYGLLSNMDPHVCKNPISKTQALNIIAMTDKIKEYASVPGNNDYVTNNGGVVPRFYLLQMDSYVYDLASLIHMYGDGKNGRPEITKDVMDGIVDDFLKCSDDRLLIDYIKNHPLDVDIRVRGMGSSDCMMFYANPNETHGISRDMLDAFANKRQMKVAFVSNNELFNEDAYICYDPNIISHSNVPSHIKDFIKSYELQHEAKETKASDVVIRNNSYKTLRQCETKDGVSFYKVSVLVPDGISDKNCIHLLCDASNLKESQTHGKFDLQFNSDAVRMVVYVKDGGVVRKQMSMQELAQLHNTLTDISVKRHNGVNITSEVSMENSEDMELH